MNDALKQFRPSSNWISAALVTVFVVSFGVIAEELRPGVTTAGFTQYESVAAFSTSDQKSSQRVLFRYR